jgi:hypothetical protein
MEKLKFGIFCIHNPKAAQMPIQTVEADRLDYTGSDGITNVIFRDGSNIVAIAALAPGYIVRTVA